MMPCQNGWVTNITWETHTNCMLCVRSMCVCVCAAESTRVSLPKPSGLNASCQSVRNLPLIRWTERRSDLRYCRSPTLTKSPLSTHIYAYAHARTRPLIDLDYYQNSSLGTHAETNASSDLCSIPHYFLFPLSLPHSKALGWPCC